MSKVFTTEPDFEDGTNVLVGTAYREEEILGRALPLYVPAESKAPANWRDKWAKLRERMERLVDDCRPVECTLIQTRMPAYGLDNTLELDWFPEALRSGPGLQKLAANLFTIEGSPLSGRFAIRDAKGKPMLKPDGQPQAFRLGAWRQIIVAAGSYGPGDPRPVPDPQLAELARDGTALLYDLPAEVAVSVWKNWSSGFSRAENTNEFLWLDALFELSWQKPPGTALSAPRRTKLGSGSVGLVGDGLFPRLPSAKGFDLSNSVPNDGGHPMRWTATLTDVARASIAAIDEILERGTQRAKPTRLKPITSAVNQTNIPDSIPLDTARRKKVFISYAHSSPEHRQTVNDLVTTLRAADLTVLVDTDVETPQGPPEGWPKWMKQMIKEADWILLFFDETYRRRFDGDEEPNKGLGATWEGTIITHQLYRNPSRNTRFIPLLTDTASTQIIPDELSGATSYRIPKQSAELAAAIHQTVGQGIETDAENDVL